MTDKNCLSWKEERLSNRQYKVWRYVSKQMKRTLSAASSSSEETGAPFHPSKKQACNRATDRYIALNPMEELSRF